MSRMALPDARLRADLALVIVTLLWGVTFPLVRSAVQDLDPHLFVAARFTLAMIAFLPLIVMSSRARRALPRAWPRGLGLGALVWTSYLTQTIGLQTVPAARAAFITGTCVVLVPLMSPLFRAGRPSRVDVAAAAVATLGLFLLTEPAGSGFTAGDAWILACAVIYAAYIHVLQHVLRGGHHEVALAFLQVVGVAACSLLSLPVGGVERAVWSDAVWAAVLVCALLVTVGTFWLQTRYQGRTTPERTALIFSMEPVFATIFAYFLLGETLAPVGVAGAGLILLAVVGAELLHRPGSR